MPQMHEVSTPVLSIHGLTFEFPALVGPGSRALDELSLDLARGGCGVVLGAADAGKTTLARIVGGLIPRFTGGRIEGSVRICGSESLHARPFELVERLGTVAQDSEQQLLTTRCDTEVAFALESLGVPRVQMRARVSSALETVGLPEFAARNPATLSGGEKKRLLVACLVALRPELWILDEALAELDFDWKAKVLDIAAASGGTTLVMESRWSSLAASHGTSFFLMTDGRIRSASGTASDRDFSSALLSAGLRPSARAAPSRSTGRGHLSVEGLRFGFEAAAGFRLEVESLSIDLGEICALVGRNGSGKSTLGKLLCGLLRPQAGTISIEGHGGPVAENPEALRARIGYLFQNPDHQIFLPTVREELGLGLRPLRQGSGEKAARIAEAAALFGLPDLEAPPALLSFGARRRLQAATYYLLSRDLLILDEIDSGLSYGEFERLLDAISSHVPGLIVITHDLVLARSVSHRVLVVDDGRIVSDAGPDSLPEGGRP